MPPKADASRQQGCWECLRRCLACDGRRPVCERCRSAGIVCPGFEDRRPLTWVTPGNITVTRIRRAKTTAAATSAASKKNSHRARPLLLLPSPDKDSAQTESSAVSTTLSSSDNKSTEDNIDSDVISLGASDGNGDDEQGVGNDDGGESASSLDHLYPAKEDTLTPQTTATSFALVSQKGRCSISTQRQSIGCIPVSLQLDEFELMEAVEYYNHYIFPAISSNQITTPNAYSKRFDKNRVSRLVTSNRHALISISIGFRILAVAQSHRPSINPRVVGPASDLWTSFFRHVGLAMAALKDEIRQDPKRHLANIFRSIHLIASSELFLLNSPYWRAHVSGFMAILQEQGGLGTFVQNPGNSIYIMLSFLVSCIVVNTTSSQQNQIIEVTCLNPKELYSLYKVSIYPPFFCPPDLFLDILYINRLRLQLPTTSVIYSLPSIEVTVCDILRHIHEFSPLGWIESCGSDNPEGLLLLPNIYQAAVALYAILVLPCTSKFHVKRSCQELKQTYRAQLFDALRTAVGSSVRIHNIYWPVVVAGVAASNGTAEERLLVEEHLNMGINDPYSGAGSLKALAVLRRAWAFGLTEWDECFSEPNVILFP
ncbi:hypothetical protein J3F83DRAFT_625785 [Trichoderma novae-zelandiae]